LEQEETKKDELDIDEEGYFFQKRNGAFKFYVRNKIINGAVRS